LSFLFFLSFLQKLIFIGSIQQTLAYQSIAAS
jgi:hypothetical protein